MKPKYICKVFSIDAWGNRRDGYEWNQWWITPHKYVGELSRRSIIRFLKNMVTLIVTQIHEKLSWKMID